MIDNNKVGAGGLAPRPPSPPRCDGCGRSWAQIANTGNHGDGCTRPTPVRPLSEREIAANYMDRIKRAIEVLDAAYGHADAPHEPAALNALHILRGLDLPSPAATPTEEDDRG